jgi:hypothetical protein
MLDPQVTHKMSSRALRLLRIIAAFTGEKQHQVLSRLLEAEAKRLAIKAD